MINSMQSVTLIVFSSILMTGVALGATVSGKINGHGCVHHGGSCPTSVNDPHLAMEADFVLQKPDGEYYFMTNVPRDTKVRYALRNVTVTGEINTKYSNILVDELKVDGKTVWSQKMQEEAFRELYREGGGMHH